MHVGTQISPRNDDDYRMWAQLGVTHVCIDPPGNRLHIEPHMPPDLHEWDATLVDQPANVAVADAEVAGHGVDVDQRGQGCVRART